MITNVEVYSSLSTAPDLPLAVGGTGADDPIQIRDLQGLGPVKAAVNTKAQADKDGEFYTGTSVGKRNIVLIVGLNADWVNHTVSSLRQDIYGYFMPKQPVRLRLFSDDLPAVEIEGYTESADPNLFSQDPEMVMSIICPAPDFIAVSQSQIAGVAKPGADWVDFTVVGNVETSVDLLVSAADTDPTNYDGVITFEHKMLNGPVEPFAVNGSIDASTDLHINSVVGGKKAENLFDGGEKANLLNTMSDDSVWPKLVRGTNSVRVLLDAGAADKEWTLTYFERFGGL